MFREDTSSHIAVMLMSLVKDLMVSARTWGRVVSSSFQPSQSIGFGEARCKQRHSKHFVGALM